ncbi:MAG TPA: hypothetical protein VNL70_03400, partial [Tepidisphaeraceae bacterium]|nr:hypothetical protein [Tepidisphaeraceae bacterium]
MAKTPFVRESEDVGAFLRSFEGDAVPYGQVLDLLNSTLPFAEAVVVSSMPRGGLQVIQPPRLPDTLVKAYSRQFHSHDRLTWQ